MLTRSKRPVKRRSGAPISKAWRSFWLSEPVISSSEMAAGLFLRKRIRAILAGGRGWPAKKGELPAKGWNFSKKTEKGFFVRGPASDGAPNNPGAKAATP